MSIVKLDLRGQNQQQQVQNSSAKQPPAPLVKIDLHTPEKQNERKSDHQVNQNANVGISSSANFGQAQNNSNNHGCHISPTSSNISLAASNMTTVGSINSINQRSSPLQANSIANFMHSPQSIGSSPSQSKNNTPLIMSSACPQSSSVHQANYGQSANNTQSSAAAIANLIGTRNSIQQDRKISQNSTEVSHDESQQNIQQLQRKLELQVQENVDLKEQLVKEKSKIKMIITENLTMQEELRKAQQKLKEYESLNMMRQSQAISHRASCMRSSPSKKVYGNTYLSQHNHNRQDANPSMNFNKNEISADFSYDKYTPRMFEPQMQQKIHQNQLSQHSILDILHNLNCEDESFLTDRQKKEVISPSDKQKSVKVSQFNKSKTTSLSSQIRRRSNFTPSFTKFENISNMPKKVF